MSDDKSQNTEQPTPKKLKDARKKGQVSKSKDVTTNLSLIAVFLVFWLRWDITLKLITEFTINVTNSVSIDFDQALSQLIDHSISIFLQVILPLICASAVASILGNVMQIGMLFAPDQIMPKLERISLMGGIKRIFGLKNFMEFVKSFVKLILLVCIIILVFYGNIEDILRIHYCDVYCAIYLAQKIVAQLSIVALLSFMVIALLDVAFQKYQFMKDQMMSLEDIKKERKNSDGDPHIKGKRKQLQKELSNSDINMLVKDLCLIIKLNNRMLGIKYTRGIDPLPMVTIKQQDEAARKIETMSKKYDIPVYEDEELFKKIWKETAVDSYISADVIGEIAPLVVDALSKKDGA
ncbi:MAG: type III secretion protein U [Lentisphaeria bacterium]|jgi:type III secretion protein U